MSKKKKSKDKKIEQVVEVVETKSTEETPTTNEVSNDTIDEIVEEPILLERLQFRIFDDSIDILYRPNHTYLRFIKKDDNGIQLIKSLLEMNRDDFKKVLKETSNFPYFSESIRNEIAFSRSEEWWNGAWKSQTDKLLEELGLTNVMEEPIYSNELV